MDMGIVNAGMLEVYEEIEPELKVSWSKMCCSIADQMQRNAWWITVKCSRPRAPARW